jgi:hypothetical protein
MIPSLSMMGARTHGDILQSSMYCTIGHRGGTIISEARDEGMSSWDLGWQLSRPSAIRPKSAINLLLSRRGLDPERPLQTFNDWSGANFLMASGNRPSILVQIFRSDYLRETRTTLDDFWEFALVSHCNWDGTISRVSVVCRPLPDLCSQLNESSMRSLFIFPAMSQNMYSVSNK